MREAYGGKLDAKEWGLLRAPRVDTVHGLIFCSLDADAPSLQDYLGDAVPMMDAIFGLHPSGMKALGPPERYVVKSDWKIGAENFGGDAWHVGTAHYSATLAELVLADVRKTGPYAVSYVMQNGHNFLGHRITDWFGPDFEFWGYPKDLVEQFDLSGFNDAHKDMLRNRPPTIGTVFPNFSFARFPFPGLPGEPLLPCTRVNVWQPLSPGVMEIWSWQLGWKCSPDAYNSASYLTGQANFSSSGMFEQDDTAVWEGIARVGKSPWARKEEMALHYAQKPGKPDLEWGGSGTYYPSVFGEEAQRSFWRRWVSYMLDQDSTLAIEKEAADHV